MAQISERMLDHWIRTDIVDLRHLRNLGSGARRRFTRAEANKIVAVARMKRRIDSAMEGWQSGEFWRQLDDSGAYHAKAGQT
jgi:hypothetical protein